MENEAWNMQMKRVGLTDRMGRCLDTQPCNEPEIGAEEPVPPVCSDLLL